MPDPLSVAAGLAALKPTFDALRSAIGLIRDTKDLLPHDEKTAAITAALATAESSSRVAEAEVAKALGYELCKCEFPPVIMLTVGSRIKGTGPVFECPNCKFNTASPYGFNRTRPAD